MRRLTLVVFVLLGWGCRAPTPAPSPPPPPDQRVAWAFLDTLEERTFRFFWDLADRRTGLVPDRWPTPSFSSIAAVGFALTAYPIGVERGYVSRADARRRVLATLDFFLDAPQGPQGTGVAGHRGFFYHFLDMSTGRRFGTVELSTIDTTLLMAGVLFCQSYFDGALPEELAVRVKAEELYRRVDWRWAAARPPLVSMGWKPESGFLDPDLRGIRDAYMRGRGIDYFENSRRATYAQRAYVVLNPMGWKDYGREVWGLTACDGPADVRLTLDGRPRTFWTYSA